MNHNTSIEWKKRRQKWNEYVNKKIKIKKKQTENKIQRGQNKIKKKKAHLNCKLSVIKLNRKEKKEKD